jgi:hypothetical protein
LLTGVVIKSTGCLGLKRFSPRYFTIAPSIFKPCREITRDIIYMEVLARADFEPGEGTLKVLGKDNLG